MHRCGRGAEGDTTTDDLRANGVADGAHRRRPVAETDEQGIGHHALRGRPVAQIGRPSRACRSRCPLYDTERAPRLIPHDNERGIG